MIVYAYRKNPYAKYINILIVYAKLNNISLLGRVYKELFSSLKFYNIWIFIMGIIFIINKTKQIIKYIKPTRLLQSSQMSRSQANIKIRLYLKVGNTDQAKASPLV